MATVLLILSLLPGIIDAIKAAETIFPGAVGPVKLNFVLGLIQDTDADIAKVLPQITAVIARIVSGLNTVGTFNHAAGCDSGRARRMDSRNQHPAIEAERSDMRTI